jgi:hypothetical protein
MNVDKEEEHRKQLIILWSAELGKSQPGGFYEVLFKEGIRKLKAGVEPKKAENWLVNVEKTWRKFP